MLTAPPPAQGRQSTVAHAIMKTLVILLAAGYLAVAQADQTLEELLLAREAEVKKLAASVLELYQTSLCDTVRPPPAACPRFTC